MQWMQVGQMVMALALIIVLANFLLKKLNKMNQISSKAITIIERVPVSKSSSLCIVQIGSQYLLMSFSEKGNEIIKEFTSEEKAEIQYRLYRKQEAAKEIFDLKKYQNGFKDTFEKVKEKYQENIESK